MLKGRGIRLLKGQDALSMALDNFLFACGVDMSVVVIMCTYSFFIMCVHSSFTHPYLTSNQ